VRSETGGVESLSHKLRRVAARVAGKLGRLATMVVGFVMSMVGLAMIATIVMLPFGLFIGLLGVAVFLCGVFAPTTASDG
jgi:hypothetical protein